MSDKCVSSKLFYVLLFFFSLVAFAGVLEKEVIFDWSDLSFTKYKEYDIVTLKGAGSVTEIGEPALPQVSLLFVVPPGAEVSEVNITYFDKKEITGEYNILPAQPPRPITNKADTSFVEPKKEIYSSKEEYPLELIKSPHTGSMGGYRIASLFVYPLRYTPSEKKLTLYSKIRFQVVYKESTYPVKPTTEKQKTIFKGIIKKQVLNSEDLEVWSPSITRSLSSILLSPDTVDYVIITTSTYESYLQELALWKTKKGIKTTIVNLSWIESNYTGDDTQEKIRNFIIDANSTWGTLWFLLAGDTDEIPHRITWVMLVDGDWHDDLPCDLYFSDLDGDWDNDGDNIYGETGDNVDMYPDVFVGRASINTVAECTTFVNKVLTYEKAPPSSFIKKELLLGEFLFGDNWGEWVNDSIETLTPLDYTISKLYQSQGALNRQAVLDSIEVGYHFIHHAAHGNVGSISTASDNITSSDLDGLTNGNLLSIYVAISCLPGAFDFDCYAEHWMNNPNGGGAAACLNSRYGWGSYYGLGPSDELDVSFFEQLFEHDVRNIGVTLGNAKMESIPEAYSSPYMRWCVYELNLFGDPEMHMWTDDPGELTVGHDAVIAIGGSTFSVNISDGASPVENALVCIYKEGETYEVGYTNAFGDITLNLSSPPVTLGTMYCTVTKDNYLPYEGNVDVISPDGPWVIFDHYTLTDISGNGDGNVDPGESIQLSLTVHNVGDGDGVDITGIIRTGDPYVTLTDSMENFGDILADSLAESSVDFEVLPGCPANHRIDFELVCSDASDSTWTSYFSIPISTPDISIVPDTLNFDTTFIGYSDTLELLVNNDGGDTLRVSNITSGNPDYSVDISNFNVPPYENQAVGVIFSPTSEGTSTGNLTIESNDLNDSLLTVFLQGEGLEPPDISVSPDSLSDSLFTGETSIDTLIIHNNGNSNLTFDILILEEAIGALTSSQKSNSTSRNSPVPLTEIKKGEEDTRKYPLMIIGEGGPDGFGYRWKDSNEPGGPTFDWIDVSSGTSISMSDDDFQTGIPLGFVFNYYGTDFTTIGVGSNGWLSFNGYDDWYPSNVPYPADGYEGAIAPFARDLYPPLASYIRYQTFGTAPNRFFVVEYNNIPDFGGGNNKTFEIMFYENSNEIKFQYLIAPNDPYGLGIESPDESMGMGNAGVDSLFISPAVVENNYAIEFSLAPDWISPDITSGTVPANDSTIVEVIFDANNLNGGDYYSDIIVVSNDPDEPEVVVPAHLHVTGAPDITVSEDTLDYGIVFTSYSSTDTLIVLNEGTDSLTVSDISSDNTDYTVDITNFNLDPGENQEVVVTFTPSSLGVITGNLTITSNDPDEPTLNVLLQGEGLQPPDISVSPDSLSDSLFTGETSVDTLMIYNTGSSDLIFNISIGNLEMISANLLQKNGYEKAENQSKGLRSFTTQESSTLKPDETAGEIHDFTIGEPRPFASPLMFEDDFEDGNYDGWLDAGGSGIKEVTSTTAANGTIYSYHEYSSTYSHYNGIYQEFDSIQPGYISFYISSGSTSTSDAYCVFRNSMGDDVIWFFASQSGYLYVNGDVGGDQTYTYTAETWYHIEFKNINFTAKTFDYYVNEELIKTEIPFRNASYAEEFSRVDIYNFTSGSEAWWDEIFIATEESWWIDIDDVSGTIPAGDSTLVEVTFDATGLYGGNYYADIIIASNDPDEPEVVVPAHLHVTSIPDITVSKDTLDFGIVYPGNSMTDTLIVANEGTDSLIVSGISSDNGDYTIDTTNFVLRPEENQPVLVAFTPSSMGTITGLLTIESNDPDNSTLTIYMSGECMDPPDISVSPDSLSDTLTSGQSSNHILNIYNTGESDLDFVITIEGGGSSYALEFDGVDDYVEVPDNPSLSAIGGGLTLELWMNPGEYPFENRQVLGKWGPGGSSDDEFDIDLFSSGSIRMSTSGSTGGYDALVSGTTISPNIWTHVAGVFDSANSSLKIFFNGELDTNKTPSTITLNRDTDEPFRIGAYDFSWGSLFKGQLDEVRIWNVARTQAEIQANMNRELGGTEPGLIGYWKFDEGSGNTAYDSSPNNNDGTLHGGTAWADSAAPVIGWLYVDTTSGTTPAGDSTKIEVTFDATGLNAGDYYANIIVTSNDPDKPELIVPAHLHVPSGGIEEKEIPEVFFVKQNYPNPFNRQTVIRYGCPKKSRVCIQIFDITGRIVNTLIDKEVEAGYYQVTWEGENKFGKKTANAVYLYRIQAGDFMVTKKMIFIQ